MRTALFLSIIVLMQGAHAGSLSADIARQAQQNWPEFLDLLAIPNVADQPADIQRNATFLEQAFAKRGFKVRRLDNPAKRPAVYAELGPSARQLASRVGSALAPVVAVRGRLGRPERAPRAGE